MKWNKSRLLMAGIGVVCMWVLAACSSTGKKAAQTVTRPDFSGDSAYLFVEQQLAMGPRVPNGQGHTDCIIFIVETLRRFGAEVTLQKGTMLNYAGKAQPVVNVIGRFLPDSLDTRVPFILLGAHYDTRPWCDEEDEYQDRFHNVPGANDGASGVAVLLEIARQLSMHGTLVPIEMVFFDVEDMGTPDFYTGQQREHTWCLGSQLWAQQAVPEQYRYGILVDMVGAPDAVFPREYYSMQYAENYQEQLWRRARELGHGRYFSDEASYPIVDDHYYINLAGVPCVDIIHYEVHSGTGFPSWWHTREDDLSNVSATTLQAVGEVILSCLN